MYIYLYVYFFISIQKNYGAAVWQTIIVLYSDCLTGLYLLYCVHRHTQDHQL